MLDTSTVSNKLLYSIGIGVGITVVSGLGYWYWKRDVMPKKWQRVGTLEKIFLFPIKSCAPLTVDDDNEIECDVLGLFFNGVRDRGFMLIDDNDKMVTARVYPHMVLIHSRVIAPSKLFITYEGMEPLELDITELGKNGINKDVHTAVWDTKLDAMLCGQKYDKWFSKVILEKDSGLRLVYYAYPEPVRTINPRMVREPYIKNKDTGAFCDATSYMLINLASVDDLNTRIPNPVDPLQFRGNFYLKMDEPAAFAEDKWQWLKIGDDKVFRVVSPCTRCIFPNINVHTGKRDEDGQPSKMLKSYRKWAKYPTPVFGIHLGVRQAGAPVKKSDVVYVEA